MSLILLSPFILRVDDEIIDLIIVTTSTNLAQLNMNRSFGKLQNARFPRNFIVHQFELSISMLKMTNREIGHVQKVIKKPFRKQFQIAHNRARNKQFIGKNLIN